MSETPDRPLTSPTGSGAGAPDGALVRELSPRERDVLAVMIDRAAPVGTDERVEEADRARWRAQLATVRAGRPCGCGTCPSIELTDPAGVTPEATGSRVVLGAETAEAIVLLFVDDDRLSYLELAPTDERPFTELPPPADIRTG